MEASISGNFNPRAIAYKIEIVGTRLMRLKVYPAGIFAALLSAATAMAEPPPPAQPPGFMPLGARQIMTAEFEETLSQVLGTQVRILSSHMYREQNGGATTCVVLSAHGQRARLIGGGPHVVFPATKGQWEEGGCTRPDYQLLR